MDWFPTPYEDETLYSVLSRLWNYMGQPSTAAFSRALSGGRHWVALTPLPGQLNALSHHFGWDDAMIDRIIDNHTMFPFYTAYAGPVVRQRARAAMRQSADGLHLLLGIATSPIPAPKHLRYCSACLTEMLEQHGEGWWCRMHQLPGITVCAIHGVDLMDHTGEISQRSRHDFAVPDVAHGSEPPRTSLHTGGDESLRTALLALADGAAGLLSNVPEALDPWQRHLRIAAALRRTGLQRGTRHVRHMQLHAAIQHHWGAVLDLVPGLCLRSPTGATWLTDYVLNRRKLVHPLRHLAFNLAIENLAVIEQPFGDSPWPCLNPLIDHFQARVVTRCRHVRDKGKLHGHFTCTCGYSYSRTRRTDGTITPPRFRKFGPTLSAHVRDGIEHGRSLREISRTAHLDPKTLVREMRTSGQPVPWGLNAT